jgi:multidrug efflux pump subunit AcrA (membrane-fusion protein)
VRPDRSRRDPRELADIVDRALARPSSRGMPVAPEASMRAIGALVGFVAVVSAAFGATLLRELPATTLVPEAVASTPAPLPVVHADGRVVVRPGRQVTIGAELVGKLVRVHVAEGDHVDKGELLAELDGAEYQGLYREALGSAGEAYARLKARRDDVRRSRSLVEHGALAPLEADRAREERSAAAGRLAASNGAATRARALLQKTRIVAPIDGVVLSRFVEASETVAPGTPLFVIADLDERRVEAEVDEYDIGRIVLGGGAEVRADAFPGQAFQGGVEEIPTALSARRMRPQDPARLTDSAVLLVKVSLPRASPLKIGQRVAVTFRDAGQRQ